MIFSNTRPKSLASSDASTSRAIPTNRLWRSASVNFGFDLGLSGTDQSSSVNKNFICGSGSRSLNREGWNWRDRALCLPCSTSRFISQSFANYTAKRGIRPHGVVITDLLAEAVAEVELAQITMQVRSIAMLINADHAPLEDGEEAFDGVAVDGAARIFATAVIDRTVAQELFANPAVVAGAIGIEVAIPVSSFERAGDLFHSQIVDMDGPSTPAPFDKRDYLHLVAPAIAALPALAAGELVVLLPPEGFVGFNGHSAATDGREAIVFHRFADAMAKEPCGFHAALKHTLDLAGADALLAGAKQVDHLQPQMQRQMRGLKDGPHAHGEWLAAVIALVEAHAGGCASHLADARSISVAAVRADRTVRPKLRFDIGESAFFGLELGGIEHRLGHGTSPMARTLH